MIAIFIALSAGLLFGAGLAVSGMANPARVQGFLDLFGQWDPTLVFVMAGAMLPMSLAWVLRTRLTTPLAQACFDLPKTSGVDRNLVVGAILFGAGWGLSGLCPGPALADLILAPQQAGLFVLALFGGMAIHRFALR